tara:strand:- start:249 stop:1514 length:1266 start_codon:yes stop_codon:yes gene_type:complete
MRFLIGLLFIFFSFGSFHVDGVVAVVGSRSILRSEVLEQSTMLAQQQNISPDKNPYQFQKVFDQVLKEKIHRHLVLEVAEKDTSVSVSFEEINAELESRIEMFASSFGSVEMLEKKMEMSVKELKQEYWETVEEELLVEKYKYVLFGNISVSSQEVLDFYTTHKDSFPPTPDLFSGSIIERPIKISPSSRDSIFNLATAVKDSLVLGLLDFSTAAKKYSQDPGSSSFGGSLGFSKRGSFVSSYEKTAFGLKDGEIGEITETQFGYHIIKLEQRLGEKINTSHILFSLAPSKKDVLKTKSKLKDVFLSVEKDPGLMDSLALEAFKENSNYSGVYKNYEINSFPEALSESILSLENYNYSPVFIDGQSVFLVFRRLLDGGKKITPSNSWFLLESAATNDKRSREFQLWIDGRLSETYVKILNF